MIEIRAGAISLRRHVLDDLEDVHRWQNDPELLFLNSDSESEWSRDETRRHLERWIASHDSQSYSLYFGICIGRDGPLIGFAALALIEFQHERCRLAITIDQKHWGLGYGRQALSGLLVFAFDGLALHRVMAEVYGFNDRAIRLIRSLGFRQEGEMRDHVWKRGWQPELIFGLLRPEFEEHRPEVPSPEITLTGSWQDVAMRRAQGQRP